MRDPRKGAALVALFLALPAAAENLSLSAGTTTLLVEVDQIAPVFMHGRPSVQLSLTDTSGLAMADLTESMIGEMLTVSLCDVPLLQAVVRARLEGRAIINMPSIESAIAVTEVVNGETTCADLAQHFPD